MSQPFRPDSYRNPSGRSSTPPSGFRPPRNPGRVGTGNRSEGNAPSRASDSELKARDLATRLCGEDKRLWGLAVSVIRPVLDAGEQPNREDALAALGRRVEEIIRRTGEWLPKEHAAELRAALRELKAAQ